MYNLKEFKEKSGMKIVNPVVHTLVFAMKERDFPMVYCVPVTWLNNSPIEFVITTNKNDPETSYMFKEDGLFGHTSKKSDMFKNTFRKWEEARKAFEKFYG